MNRQESLANGNFSVKYKFPKTLVPKAYRKVKEENENE